MAAQKIQEFLFAIRVLQCITLNVAKNDDGLDRRSTLSFPAHETDKGLVDELQPALDALADICISQAKSQVIAVSAAFTRKSFNLFLAANTKETSPDSVHVTSVWNLLQATSKAFLTTDHKTDAYVSASEELGAQVYAHSWSKFTKIITKRLRHFKDFSEYLHKSHSHSMPVKFNVIEEFLGYLGGAITEKPQDWVSFSKTCLAAYPQLSDCMLDSEWLKNCQLDYTDEVIGRISRIDDAMSAETGDDSLPVQSQRKFEESCEIFDCLRYIRKVFLYQSQISALVNFASSQSCAKLLSAEFHLTILSPPPTSPRPPKPDPESVDKLLRACYATTPQTKDSSTNKTDSSSTDVEGNITALCARVDERHGTMAKEFTVHAECTITHYHHNHPNLTLFPYIGISKLSCYACSLYLDSYNRLYPAQKMQYEAVTGMFIHGCLLSMALTTMTRIRSFTATC